MEGDAGARGEAANLMITVIALAHGASVVTDNRKHYERIEGLRIEDRIRDSRTEDASRAFHCVPAPSKTNTLPVKDVLACRVRFRRSGPR